MSTIVMIMVPAVVTGATLTFGVCAALLRLLRDRPPVRSSARDRLLERNPALAVGRELRWSVRARRVRIGWLTVLSVAVAVLVVADRPTTVGPPTVGR